MCPVDRQEIDAKDMQTSTDAMDKICMTAFNTGKWDTAETVLLIKVCGVWMAVLPTGMDEETFQAAMAAVSKNRIKMHREAS